MIIDVIYAIIVILAIFKGFRQGLIVAVFSLVAFIIGLAAALKLSSIVASYLGKAVKVSDEWLPIISFAVVFFIVYLLVRWGARVIEKTVNLTPLGWINKLGGAVFFLALYTTIFSVLLFFADQTRLIKDETKEKSVTYSFVQPWGPKAINGLGAVIPIFRNMFTDLEDFFGKISDDIPKPK